MSIGPEGFSRLPAEEEAVPLRLPLHPARQELIRSALESGTGEEELTAMFGKADVAAYLSNPYNIDGFGDNDAA